MASRIKSWHQDKVKITPVSKHRSSAPLVLLPHSPSHPSSTNEGALGAAEHLTFLRSLKTLLLTNCSIDLKYSPCPPAHNRGLPGIEPFLSHCSLHAYSNVPQKQKQKASKISSPTWTPYRHYFRGRYMPNTRGSMIFLDDFSR